MEKLKLSSEYSMKNIPLAAKKQFLKKFVAQQENLLYRMRWKAYFAILKNHEKETEKEDELFDEKKENYGFKSGYKPPAIAVLEFEAFEKAFLDMAKSLEFRNFSNKFQEELKADLKIINSSKHVIVAADKTTNYYKCDKDEYEKRLIENITCEYKRADEEELNVINKKAAEIAKNLELANRMQKHTQSQCYVTFKDHKNNFMDKKPCRLINPAKTDIGKVSKHILENLNKEVREITLLNQWRSTPDVIRWFNNINKRKKMNYKFFKFDIVSFYPSITPNLLDNALKFARELCFVSQADINIVLQSRQTFLFHKNTPWIKKGNSNGKFDVPMGSWDGAEVCELVGLYLLHQLTSGTNKVFDIQNVGLYRDDGLAIVRETGRTLEKFMQKVREIFKSEGLSIEIEAGSDLKITDFLDLTLNLSTMEHRPYMKPNNKPRYINCQSNHPPKIIEHMPKMIEQRISANSSNEKIFNEEVGPYKNALKESGYNSQLQYKVPVKNPEKRKRRRKIMYFNPPFCKSVKTNIGRVFLDLVRKHFPKTSVLGKVFNKNNLKISYCTMPNMNEYIAKHNNKIYNQVNENEDDKKCICRKSAECPMNGNCAEKSVVYQAKVVHHKSKLPDKFYYGSTSRQFKKRYYGHVQSFKNENSNPTGLSKYVWKLKNSGWKMDSDFKIKWSILTKAYAFSLGGKKCDLCLTEKTTIILHKDQNTLLNRRDEILTKCRHKEAHCLSSVK